MFLLIILFGLAALGLAFALYLQAEAQHRALPSPVKPAAMSADPSQARTTQPITTTGTTTGTTASALTEEITIIIPATDTNTPTAAREAADAVAGTVGNP